jgi:acetoin utilization deacetylase AcuC-like enzyme
MATGLLTHAACLGHETPPGHPESVDRLRAVLHALEAERFQYLIRQEASPASREALCRAHTPALVDRILGPLAEEAAREHYVHIDADTVMSQGSAEAALRAAGAVIDAVDLVMAGTVRNAFCAVRPPGHHAERGRAMGFCLFNNVAVGALHARAAHGLRRVATIDFDVHHGNGTQDIAEADPDFFYASTHQFPLYPGTGRAEERGVAGNIVNAPVPPGAGSEAFRSAMIARVLPALEAFRPDIVFISAGFDAHRLDPLAELRLAEEDYAWATAEICARARGLCGGRVVSSLEGGYDLAALAASAAAHVGALMEA